MPVHLYGHPAAMDRFTEIAQRHNLLLFEDAAQAHTASLHATPVGAWGVAGSFSFYPTKNMTSGEGGMLTTESGHIDRQARLLRNQGMEKRYQNEAIGFNNRMSDVHAAIGRVQLTKLAGWTKQRQDNAAFLDAHLEGVVVPLVAVGATHVYHQYTILVVGHDRDAFATQLHERGVGSGVYYPTPVHRLPSYGVSTELPVTERMAQQCLSLPVHPSLEQAELERIIEAVNTVAKAGS
jgi:dTDP-4-amino-4,6-dideoxygalactose transaminase